MFILIPTGDSIVGHIYFNHLCKTQAGVKVYQTIELPAKYWDKDGKPRFYDDKNGNLKLPLDQYATGKSKIVKRPFNIEERHSILRDKQTGELLSEETWFLFWGGWVSKNFSPHNSALMCGRGVDRTTQFVSKLFKPAEAVNEEGDNGNNQ